MSTDTRELRAFVDAAVRWCRDGAPADLERLIRSPFSGVPHDAAAAFATIGARTGSLLDAVDRRRLAVAPEEFDAALQFAARLRALQTSAASQEDEPLRDDVARVFELPAACEPTAPGDAREAFSLAEPVERETPSGVPPRHRHFSASALNAYAECARKWFYRYACGAVEDKGSAASAYGTAVHLALEDFHGEFPRPSVAEEAQMRARIKQHVQWAFERNRDGFPTEVEFELQRRRAQRTAQRYVGWVLAQERTAPFEVIGREVPANLELEGYPFVGFIDRLDRDERTGGVGVVDYKTGTIATSAHEYREKVRTFADFQLPFYYWARVEAGDRVTRLVLVPLKDALLDVRPIVLEVIPGDGRAAPSGRRDAPAGIVSVIELERARTRMIELARELSSGEIERFPVTTDPSACAYCAYANACAGKPAPEPERFAR